MESPSSIFPLGAILAGTYEIRSLLGGGGMGQVFEAHDRALNRRVAIKANYPDVEGGFTVRTEAQALAAIRHPGVVGVYALGVHEGVDYMVMEHIAGVTLSQHLERLEKAGLPLAERIDVLIAIADGLAAIHRAGLSHGDVKPDNVLLAASGRVVLTDLGLVRAAYDQEAGLVAGTPDYMAPETFSARSSATYHLVDAYAFGVMAFRLLAGKLPYESESIVELLTLHSQAPVPPLPETARAPRRLAELVESLMAKDPNDRPATMDAVVWQLRAVRDALTSGAEKLTVLIIDDDPDIARLVATYVRQAAPRAEVSLASGAAEALDHFRRGAPRLVFLDLMMPRMSGFELYTYLRGVNMVDASTVIAMSAGGSMTDIELMLELGVHDFIPKGPELRPRVTKVVSTLAAAL